MAQIETVAIATPTKYQGTPDKPWLIVSTLGVADCIRTIGAGAGLSGSDCAITFSLSWET